MNLQTVRSVAMTVGLLSLFSGCRILPSGAPATTEDLPLSLELDRAVLGMGQSAVLQVCVRVPEGTDIDDWELLPEVDGSRWGAHHPVATDGPTEIVLPLPRPGLHRITVALNRRTPVPDWIWSAETRDSQDLFLSRSFDLETVPDTARLWLAVDDSAKVYLNGEMVMAGSGWHQTEATALDTSLLRPGRNLVTVEAHNGSGPAGLLMELELGDSLGQRSPLLSDGDWHCGDERPEDWPAKGLGTAAAKVTVHGNLDAYHIRPPAWLKRLGRERLFAGTVLPAELPRSAPVTVDVRRRELSVPEHDPEHRVGVHWEPWFTPMNPDFTTAEAVPLCGFYWSYNRDVTRQHAIWMVESGVDFLMADWSNHIWFSSAWDDRGENCNEIIHATTLALEELAAMRDEGIPVPRMTLLSGISHAADGVNAVNGQLDWIYHNYIRNPRFRDLWVEYEGKPLVTFLDLPGTYWRESKPVDPQERFTIRYTNVANGTNRMHENGFWSWMDVGEPMVTRVGDVAEAVTVSCGYFGSGGWLGPEARGHRGGATFIETMRTALEHRPRFLLLHQFNEFAGQAEGQGHGPDRDHYYDTYSTELTDDFEPTALATPAYRGDGGWGFLYLNLARAMLHLYRHPETSASVVVIESPLLRETVRPPWLQLRWQVLGTEPATFDVEVNGRIVAGAVRGRATCLDLRGLAPGPLRVRVTGNGPGTPYRLSYTEASLPRSPAPAPAAEVEVVLAPPPQAHARPGPLPDPTDEDPQTMASSAFPTVSPESVGVSSTRLERAIDFIRQEVDNGTVPGAVLVATRNGSKFVEFACGTYCSCTERARPMGPEVVNACYSFSKVVSATVIATVIQEGLLDLDEPVKTYIPEFAGGGKDSITLRHLLTHAAGIPSAPVGGAVVDTASWERAVAAACAAEVEWEPGSRTAYHGLSGQFVAAEAVRRVLGGELWDEICRERLFRPLGMETFTFGLPPCSEDIALTPQPGELPFALEPASLGMAGHPGGGGFGRPEDMLRLLNLHLAGGVWNGKRLLAPEMFREMHRLQYADRIATATGRDERPAHENWGLGWLLRGDSQEHWFGFGNRVSPRTFSHAGINTVIGLADPETGMALVFLTTNSPPTDQDTVRLRNTVTNLVADALED